MQELLDTPNLMPGQLPDDARTEFFVSRAKVYCFHRGLTLRYVEFYPWMIQKAVAHREDHPHLVKEISRKPVMFDDPVENYIYYCFGRLNGTPDIDEDGTMNDEYHVCLNHGEPLSEREIDILRGVARPDKEISDRNCISNHTVNTHLQNIRHKSGLRSKPELVLEAKNEGII